MHHIIDPRTGAPARARWRTVSVAAASCADANIATTAALVRAGAGAAWLATAGAARAAGRAATGASDTSATGRDEAPLGCDAAALARSRRTRHE